MKLMQKSQETCSFENPSFAGTNGVLIDSVCGNIDRNDRDTVQEENPGMIKQLITKYAERGVARTKRQLEKEESLQYGIQKSPKGIIARTRAAINNSGIGKMVNQKTSVGRAFSQYRVDELQQRLGTYEVMKKKAEEDKKLSSGAQLGADVFRRGSKLLLSPIRAVRYTVKGVMDTTQTLTATEKSMERMAGHAVIEKDERKKMREQLAEKQSEGFQRHINAFEKAMTKMKNGDMKEAFRSLAGPMPEEVQDNVMRRTSQIIGTSWAGFVNRMEKRYEKKMYELEQTAKFDTGSGKLQKDGIIKKMLALKNVALGGLAKTLVKDTKDVLNEEGHLVMSAQIAATTRKAANLLLLGFGMEASREVMTAGMTEVSEGGSFLEGVRNADGEAITLLRDTRRELFQFASFGVGSFADLISGDAHASVPSNTNGTLGKESLQANAEKEKIVQEFQKNEKIVPEKYIVQRGDGFWSIVRKYEGVSSIDLKEWNKDQIGVKGYIYPGQKLVVSAPNTVSDQKIIVQDDPSIEKVQKSQVVPEKKNSVFSDDVAVNTPLQSFRSVLPRESVTSFSVDSSKVYVVQDSNFGDGKIHLPKGVKNFTMNKLDLLQELKLMGAENNLIISLDKNMGTLKEDGDGNIVVRLNEPLKTDKKRSISFGISHLVDREGEFKLISINRSLSLQPIDQGGISYEKRSVKASENKWSDERVSRALNDLEKASLKNPLPRLVPFKWRDPSTWFPGFNWGKTESDISLEDFQNGKIRYSEVTRNRRLKDALVQLQTLGKIDPERQKQLLNLAYLVGKRKEMIDFSNSPTRTVLGPENRAKIVYFSNNQNKQLIEGIDQIIIAKGGNLLSQTYNDSFLDQYVDLLKGRPLEKRKDFGAFLLGTDMVPSYERNLGDIRKILGQLIGKESIVRDWNIQILADKIFDRGEPQKSFKDGKMVLDDVMGRLKKVGIRVDSEGKMILEEKKIRKMLGKNPMYWAIVKSMVADNPRELGMSKSEHKAAIRASLKTGTYKNEYLALRNAAVLSLINDALGERGAEKGKDSQFFSPEGGHVQVHAGAAPGVSAEYEFLLNEGQESYVEMDKNALNHSLEKRIRASLSTAKSVVLRDGETSLVAALRNLSTHSDIDYKGGDDFSVDKFIQDVRDENTNEDVQIWYTDAVSSTDLYTDSKIKDALVVKVVVGYGTELEDANGKPTRYQTRILVLPAPKGHGVKTLDLTNELPVYATRTVRSVHEKVVGGVGGFVNVFSFK